MRRSLLLLGASALLAGPLTAPAMATDVPVSIAVVGGRSLTSATVATLADGVPSALSAAVTETVAPGDNAWSVTAQLCKPNATTPTQSDCSSSALVSTTDTTKTIAGTSMAISNRAVTASGGGGTSSAPTGSQTLSVSRTIFSNAGQSPLTNYTGVYTGTANVTLSVPAGTAAGIYNGFVVVDLVQ